jgi:hypothetical protein
MKVLRYGDEPVSVAFEEADATDSGEKLYEPDIVRKADPVQQAGLHDVERPRVARMNERQV